MTSSNFYYSNDQVICLCPRPALLGLALTPKGEAYRLRYQGGSCGTVRGLHLSDCVEHEPNVIIYQLADGTLLAADEAAIEKAGVATNWATNHKRKCLEHQLKDLQIVEGMPVKTRSYALVK